MRVRTHFYGKYFRASLTAIVVTALIACGDNKKDDQATMSDSAPAAGNEAAISGTIRLDPALQSKVGKSRKEARQLHRHRNADFTFHFPNRLQHATLDFG